METPPTLRVVLYLHRDTDPIRGAVEDDHGARRPFYGWLELSALLDSLCGPGTPGNGPGQLPRN